MKNKTKQEEYNLLLRYVEYVANTYIELSNDKTAYQRDDMVKKARELLAKLEYKG